jgi:Divergent InlB B-repeat domain
MRGKWISLVVLAAAASALLAASSCARSQQLVTIQIQPSSETIGATTTPLAADAGYHVQLTALGGYIHPPVTKDITDQVTWVSTDPQMFSINSTGVLTATGNSCGTALISASLTTNTSEGGISSSGAVVTGYMTAGVVCFTSSGGGSGNPILTMSFLGTGTGTVTSSPSGFSCTNPGPCATQAFIAGTPITLTATPNSGSTFGSWTNCPTTPSANVCAFTVAADENLTVTFN